MRSNNLNYPIILANSMHLFFTAMKQLKFQNHCDYCDEILIVFMGTN